MSALLIILAVFGFIAGGIWLILQMRGADHSQYDTPAWPVRAMETFSDAHKNAEQAVRKDAEDYEGLKFKARLNLIRERADARGAEVRHNCTILRGDAQGVMADWVLAPGADPAKRLMYIHGGAYMAGSAQSHRYLACRLSELTGASVFVPDYRLMPEHRRMDGIKDCRRAWEYMLSHGPQNDGPAQTAWLAGDSSGGNLALSLMLWLRDEKRRNPDAVLAFSPQTDVTFQSPSLRRNLEQDVMQGTGFGPIARASLLKRLIFAFMMHQGRPDDPRLSPLHGDLSQLPPVLIQTSDHDMFEDDCVRFINKMNTFDSMGTLQIWPGMLHVWQAFDTPEGNAALVDGAHFLQRHG